MCSQRRRAAVLAREPPHEPDDAGNEQADEEKHEDQVERRAVVLPGPGVRQRTTLRTVRALRGVIDVDFRTGDARLRLRRNQSDLDLTRTAEIVYGAYVTLSIHPQS